MMRVVAFEPDDAATPATVRRLLSELSTEELEPITLAIVREHRRRLQCAQELFEALECSDNKRATAAELRQLRQDYRMAMLNLHVQHQLVSLVIAALGYVPDVDSPSPDDGTPR